MVLEGEGGASGGHGDGSQLAVSADEVPVTELNMTRVGESLDSVGYQTLFRFQNFNQLFQRCLKKELVRVVLCGFV